MPELAEVETVRASLARDLIGKRVKTVAVTNGRAVRRHKTAKDFRTLVEGHSIKSISRLGKNLVIGLDNQTHLVIHLGMSGQLLRAKSAKDPKPKHTHVVFSFVQGGELRYVGDGLALRKAVPELAHLGLDPFEDQIGWDRFAAILRSRATPLKAVLTDQDIIAGIGNIYADEILFASGLRFDRPAESLSTIEIRRLHRAITEVLTEAIKHGGSTLDDEQFVDPDAKPGNYQQFHQVYNREGQACFQCRQPLQRESVRGRSTYFCVKCQA